MAIPADTGAIVESEAREGESQMITDLNTTERMTEIKEQNSENLEGGGRRPSLYDATTYVQ